MESTLADTPVSLLDRLRDRPDVAAWKRWFALYEPLLRRWIGQHALQPTDADDVVGEVLVTVVRELPRFRHGERTGAFRRWLRTILVHRLRQMWAARGSPQGPPNPDGPPSLDQLEDPDSPLSRV